MGNPQAAPRNRSTLWGILGIIGALCCAPLGVVFGLLSLMEARKHHTSPTLAYVAFGLSAVALIGNIILWAQHNSPYGYLNR